MAIGSPQWMYASGEAYEIEQSLKFNDDDNAYLSWTPTSAGNRNTWTFSCWFKIGVTGHSKSIFGANVGSNAIYIDNSDVLTIEYYNGSGGTNFYKSPSALFRDTSAWYHIVSVWNTTSGTADDRIQLYVNGTRVTSFSQSNNPGQNLDSHINNAIEHNIGNRGYNPLASVAWDGYLAEVNFIDGQALTPADFGETGDYGEWKPIKYSGTYGTNGFYLPFKQDYSVEGFSTVLYKGTRNVQYIGGTGFKPDLTWIKSRSNAGSSSIFDSVRGVNNHLASDNTDEENKYGNTNDTLTAFNTDGFTLGDDSTGYRVNHSGDSVVAWNWDMGGSNATNTDGTITSTVRANPTYGQSIVSYSGNGTNNATVGHGLSSAPELVIIKRRDAATNWNVGADAIGWANHLYLNTSAAQLNGYNPITGQASTLEISNDSDVNNSSGTYIAYCFHSVTGYSKIGTYTGNGSTTGPTVTTGFKPAFVMLKRTNASGNDWIIHDSTRDPSNPNDAYLAANEANAEGSYTPIDFLDTGFQPKTTHPGMNDSGSTYIYMAFADKREYAYWLDQSGNNNDWTSNNLTESDISVDSPSNNFATLNPLWKDSAVGLAEGNLKFWKTGNMTRPALSTIGLGATGKWYCEFYDISGGSMYAGVQWAGTDVETHSHDSGTYAYVANHSGGYYANGSYTGFSSSITSGQRIRMIAYDASTGKMWIGANGTWSGNPADGSGELLTVPSGYRDNMHFVGAEENTDSTNGGIANFGQDSSFAGNKTAQGNQDGNDIGDFYYTPPTGFLALCTKNLPDVAVVPSEHFNTVLYTGNATADHAITVGYQPDWVWLKNRTDGHSHRLIDAVRGDNKVFYSNTKDAEEVITSGSDDFNFTSTGFTLPASDSSINANNKNYVAWNWKANGSGSSNTDGSITSTVSANVDAGFSIVSYTGTGSSATVGHGLNQKPDLAIFKSRTDSTQSFIVEGEIIGSSNPDGLRLNSTEAKQSESGNYNNAGASVFNFPNGWGGVNASSGQYICYAFHSVDGYSKVGSYTGNGNADGTFVYTGFRPAFYMTKRTDAAGNWRIYDSKREGYNPVNDALRPSTSEVEFATNNDILSNGFKMRQSEGEANTDGATYIYLAFASVPFKFSNAR